MAKLIKSYKRGQYEAYDDTYDRSITQSEVLNGGSGRPTSTMKFLNDTRNIEAEIYSLNGNSNGDIVTGRDKFKAVIPSLEAQIAYVDKKLARMNAERKGRGKAPVTMEEAKELHTEKLELEARRDVKLSEVADLYERLERIQNHREEGKNDSMLQYGLKMSVKFIGGRPVSVDGCRLEQNEDGLFILSESMYKGMSLEDYRKLSEEWNKERRQQAEQRYLRDCESAKASGRPLPMRKVASNKVIDKSSLFPYPSWAVNHYETVKADKR
jgi:hypothetical protein